MLASELIRTIPKAEEAAATLKLFAEDLSRYANSSPTTLSSEVLGRYGIVIAPGSPLRVAHQGSDTVSLLRKDPDPNGLLQFNFKSEPYYERSRGAQSFVMSKDNGIQIISADGNPENFPLNPAVNMISRLKDGGIYVPENVAAAKSYRDGYEVLTAPTSSDGFGFAQLLPGNKLLWEHAKELTISPRGEVNFTSPLGWTHTPQNRRLVFDLKTITDVRQVLSGDSVPSYLKR
jgi:hypothetical protein